MRLNLWKSLCVLALALGVSAIATPKSAVAQQDKDRDDQYQNQKHDQDQEQDKDKAHRGDEGRNNQGYQNRDRDDQTYRRRDHDQDNQSYQRGDREDRDRDQGYYGNQGYYSQGNRGWNQNPAYQYGFQDGRNAGIAARQGSRGFHPDQDDYYKNGMHGYTAQFGDRDQYRNAYRQAYKQGFEQGYNGQGMNRDQDWDHDRR